MHSPCQGSRPSTIQSNTLMLTSLRVQYAVSHWSGFFFFFWFVSSSSATWNPRRYITLFPQRDRKISMLFVCTSNPASVPSALDLSTYRVFSNDHDQTLVTIIWINKSHVLCKFCVFTLQYETSSQGDRSFWTKKKKKKRKNLLFTCYINYKRLL